MPSAFETFSNRIGFILTRVVVPLWVLTGAVFKLYERTPANLPSVILRAARASKDHQIDLDIMLRTLIGLELLAVGVMFFVPRFARAMAIFMLSCFCFILIAELWARATSCGCFGSIKIKPWQMLIIDGSLLVAVLIFRPAKRAVAQPGGRVSLLKPAIAMLILGAVGLGISFAVPQPQAKEPQPQPNVATASDPQVNPKPLPVPNSWYIKPSADEWVGKLWRDVDLFQLMQRWPHDLDHGKHYVVFYKRDCEHCESMVYDHLLVPLDAPVTMVQIPYSPDELMPPEPWVIPSNLPCEMLALPLGCNWIITPPLALTIVDGKIQCAVEGQGYESCLDLQ